MNHSSIRAILYTDDDDVSRSRSSACRRRRRRRRRPRCAPSVPNLETLSLMAVLAMVAGMWALPRRQALHRILRDEARAQARLNTTMLATTIGAVPNGFSGEWRLSSIGESRSPLFVRFRPRRRMAASSSTGSSSVFSSVRAFTLPTLHDPHHATPTRFARPPLHGRRLPHVTPRTFFTTTVGRRFASTIRNQRPTDHTSSNIGSIQKQEQLSSQSSPSSSSSPWRLELELQTAFLTKILPPVMAAPSSRESSQLPPPPPLSPLRPHVILLLLVSGGCDSMALLHALMNSVERRPSSSSTTVVHTHAFHDDECFPWQWKPCSTHTTSPTHAAANTVRDQKEHGNHPHTRDSQMMIRVVHFDHQQRGTHSDGDRLLVQEVSRHYNLPIDIYYWNSMPNDEPPSAPGNDPNHPTGDRAEKPTGVFSQTVARQWRQRTSEHLLSQLLQTYCADETPIQVTHADHPVHDGGRSHASVSGALVTAHHLDDSNETLLLKVLRGSHLTNWHGMKTVTLMSSNLGRDDDGDDHVSSHNHDIGGHFWARPLLTVRKRELMEYLVARRFEWREDGSNHSNKYQRNRVRNELVPLLADLVGGEDILQRRLDNIITQAAELKEDLTSRSRMLLESSVGGGELRDIFLLPATLKSEAPYLNMIHKDALHQWVTSHTRRPFSYMHLQQVTLQLTDFPTLRQWRLNIGGGWDIQRNGDALSIHLNESLKNGQRRSHSMADGLNIVPLAWRNASNDTKLDDEFAPSNVDSLLIEISCDDFNCLLNATAAFYIDTESTHAKQRFSPPWFHSEDGDGNTTRRSPIKVVDFLRGQKVPLHMRQSTPVLCLSPIRYYQMEGNDKDVSSNLNNIIVAVFVTTTGKWICDAQFIPSGTKATERKMAIRLLLPEHETSTSNVPPNAD